MTNTQASVSTWSPVVEQIRTGSESAVEERYKSLRSIHFFFKREIGLDRADDAYHNLIITVVGAIKSGTLRQAEALPAYAMTIARRMVSEDLKEVIRARRNPDVEHVCLIARSPNPEQHESSAKGVYVFNTMRLLGKWRTETKPESEWGRVSGLVSVRHFPSSRMVLN